MNSFESAFEIVKGLVKDFKENEEKYLSAEYQEAEVRRDFIDKFFEALGWDVYHNVQKNPYEQEVKVEKGVSVGKAQKRADYAFFISPEFRQPKFFAEAKKPSRNLKNADDYYQTIRYGWNSGTPVAALTDFEEFHILDCRYKPNLNTVLKNPNHKSYQYTDYEDEEKFREIYHLFSRADVADNSLEKYSGRFEKGKGKSKTVFKSGIQTIDDDFLEYIDKVRENLAKAFKKNDTKLSSEELTEATQRTIDRIVFIRFLEDKLIEPEYYISEFGKRGNAWTEFISVCRKLDAKYNGIVFKKHFIDEQNFQGPEQSTFKKICEEMSYLNSPYDFNAIPIHILGSIYERFLGKVVNATAQRVKVEEKPEVRKAGGVYYTPKYIVDYIVDNTVGKILRNETQVCHPGEGREPLVGKTPAEISKLRFADIACGSGSFLIGVFETLLKYHTEYYQSHPEQAKKDGCIEKDGQWILSIKQKQNILLNNIYGVDIDNQAVEVTQLSLALKMLEDETGGTANEMQALFHEKILPDLTKNIVCGNSLIGTDILDGKMFPTAEERKLNPMDFEKRFPHIFCHSGESRNPENNGFDAIVGNPPYLSLSALDSKQQNYFKRCYINSNNSDIYCLFIEKCISILKKSGLLSFITSSQWLQTNYGYTLREFLIKHSNPTLLINFGGVRVFKNATVDTTILIISKDYFQNNLFAFEINKISKINLLGLSNDDFTHLDISTSKKWIIINNKSRELKEKIKSKSKLLEDKHVEIYRGILTGLNEAYIVDTRLKNELCKIDKNNEEIFFPILRGRDTHRYYYQWANLWLIKTNNGININKYPLIYEHLKSFGDRIRSRADQGDNWWNLRACSYYDKFECEKIIYPETTVRRSEFVYDTRKMYIDKTCFMIIGEDLKFLNAILSSKLEQWYIENELRKLGKNSIQYSKQFMLKIPIPKVDVNSDNDIFIYNNIIKYTEQIIGAKKQLQTVKTDRDILYYQNICTDLDNAIDAEIYKLYGLTEEEIKIVEGKI